MNIIELTRILNEANSVDVLKNKIVNNVSKIPSNNEELLPKLNQIEKLTSFYASSAKSKKNVIKKRLIATGFFDEDDAWLERFVSNLTTEDIKSMSRIKNLQSIQNVPLTNAITTLRDHTPMDKNRNGVGKYEILLAFLLGGTKCPTSQGDVTKGRYTYEVKTNGAAVGYLDTQPPSFDINNELTKKVISRAIQSYIRSRNIKNIVYFFDTTVENKIMYKNFDVRTRNGIENFINSFKFTIARAYSDGKLRVKINNLIK